MSLSFDGFELDLDRFELRRGDDLIALEPQAFEVLALLVAHRDRVVSKDELLGAVWGTEYVSDGALSTRIKEVRRALGDDGRAQRVVRTIYRRGYRFVAEVIEDGEDDDPRGASAPSTAEAPLTAALPVPTMPAAPPPDAFVGRAWELRRLRAAADEAIGGRGGLAMLVGEPGIGKTRTAQELEAYAARRGAQVLWGRARESSGAPPYHPWVQIGDAYGRSHDLAVLGLDLGPNANELARLFPELPSLVPGLEPPGEIVDAGSTQFRMFEAFVAFLRSGSERQPLVLVLDDLHWADAASLALLQHLAPELVTMRTLVIGTYRDTEVTGGAPLARILARLSRERNFVRIDLDGLSEVEVGDYLRERGPARGDDEAALAQRVHAQTEGNPFFVNQVVQLLNEEEGSLAATSDAAIMLPEGVRDALSVRLERLTDGAHAMLHVGAVIGRQFELATLATVLAEDDDAVVDLLEEALAGRVIEDFERPGRYRFVHALMQETLLAKLSATRQARTHGAVAEALETSYGERADERAPRLAYHFAESARLYTEHVDRTIRYSTLAARQAEAQSAWDEAAIHYERCLVFAGETIEREVDVAAIRLALGRCQLYSNASRAAWRNLVSALDAFRARSDWEPAADAVLLISELQARPTRQLALLSSVLEEAGDELTVPRQAGLLARRAQLRSRIGEEVAATPDAEAAEELIVGLDLPGVEARLLSWRAGEQRAAPDGGGQQEAFMRAARLFDRAGNADAAGEAIWSAANEPLRVGPLTRIDDAIEELLSYSHSRGLRLWAHVGQFMKIRLAVLRGDRSEAMRLLVEADMPAASYLTRIARATIAELGDWPTEIDELLAAPESAGGDPQMVISIHAARLRTFVLAGRRDEMRDALAAAIGLMKHSSRRTGRLFFMAGDVLAEVDDEDFVKWSYDYLVNGPTNLAGYAGSTDNLRGRIALRLDRLDEAGRHLEAALAFTEGAGWPVERGRVHQALAELAERRGQHAEAARHLAEAAALFAHYGADVFLKQVQASASA